MLLILSLHKLTSQGLPWALDRLLVLRRLHRAIARLLLLLPVVLLLEEVALRQLLLHLELLLLLRE